MGAQSIIGRVGESFIARVTSLGAQVVEGTGTAGTPAGGVVTVQGALNAKPVTIATAFATMPIDSGLVVNVLHGADLTTTGPLWSQMAAWNGNVMVSVRTPIIFKPLSAVVVTSETTIWTPAAGKKFRLMGYVITQGVATGNITLRDNTAGTTILVIPANTVGVVQISPSLGNGILSAAANNVLTAQGASTETISGYVFGTEE